MDKQKGEVIACHGWGFDASCWNGWKRYVEPDFDFRTFERGYFSADARSPEFSTDPGLKIVLAHSFGLHLCKKTNISDADLLIIFGGFIHFHPSAAQFKRRSKMILDQMISRFVNQPTQVLEKFYQNVFYPQNPWNVPDKEQNEELLLSDLKTLNNAVLNIETLKKVPKISILHGFDDGIVPRRKGRQLYNELRLQSKYFEIKKAGHALPFTHSDRCWSFVEPEIRQFKAQ